MITFIQQNAEIIRTYQQPAIQWAQNINGSVNANVRYAAERGVLEGITCDPMSRQDVVNYFTQDLYRGFIATMLWGHKSRGFKIVIGTDKNSIMEKLTRVKDLLEQGKTKDAFLSLCFKGNNYIKQVGPSFFTKLLYFMSKAFAPQNTPQPLILDNHMTYVHCALLLDEFHSGYSLYKWKDKKGIVWSHITNQCAANVYMDYITRINNIACTIDTTPENIEAFLSSLSPANPTSFIYKEVFDQRIIINKLNK